MGLVRGAIPENCIDEVVVPSQTHETLCIQEVGVTAGIAVALWGRRVTESEAISLQNASKLTNHPLLQFWTIPGHLY